MRLKIALAIAIAVLLWASSFAIIRSAVTAYPYPGAMALTRFSVASLTLLLYAAITRQLKLPTRRQFPALLACGFLGVTLYHPLLNYGESVVAAGAASLLINSAPLWTTLLALPLLAEKLTPRKTLGIAAGFIGVALITLGSTSAKGSFSLPPQALAIVGSAICTSIYVIFQKKFLPDISALQFTSWTIWLGTLLLVPVFGRQLFATLPHTATTHILELVYLGIFPAAIAYFTFAYATQHLHAGRVMSYLYLVPPVAMIIAWLYPGLHEIPTVLSLSGGALAIGGVALVNAPLSRKPAPIAIEEA